MLFDSSKINFLLAAAFICVEPMAKTLCFIFDGDQVDFQMTKIDRSKLYGYKEPEVLDEHENKCELATLAEDGRTVIGLGGTGIGYLTVDGNWTDKSELVPVDLDGEKITPVPSSFSAPVDLCEKVTADEYLDHNIRLVYQVDALEPNSKLTKDLNSGVIFKFDYSFRGGIEPDSGFLLNGECGQVFFTVGDSTTIEYVGLKQISVAVEEDSDGDENFDFDMI